VDDVWCGFYVFSDLWGITFFVVIWKDCKKFEEEKRRSDKVEYKDDEHGLVP
jgi:hypothetical protein